MESLRQHFEGALGRSAICLSVNRYVSDAPSRQLNWVITDYHDAEQWWVYGDDSMDATQWIDFDVEVADREVEIREGGATKISKSFSEAIPQGAVGLATFNRDAMFDDFSIDEAQYEVSRVFTNSSEAIAEIVCVRNYSSPESYTDRWFHYDFVGSIVNISDSSGAQIVGRSYEAWGNQINSDSGAWVSQGQEEQYSYGTQDYDKDVELYNLYARWYDPKVGRFLQRDPLKEDNNLYVYVSDDPLGFADPTGLAKMNIDGSCKSGPALEFAFPNSVNDCEREVEATLVKKGNILWKLRRSCIKSRCKNDTIQCFDCTRRSKCDEPDAAGRMPWAYADQGGYVFRGDHVYMCTDNWGNASNRKNANLVMKVLIHEFAHNCGMPQDHNDPSWKNKGIPYEDGVIK
jgi:RHS repeat-associated protein